jgi:hypothetical protein
LTEGGSEEGGLEELVEFLLARCHDLLNG